MSAGVPTGCGPVFERYLDEVLVSGPPGEVGAQVKTPRHSQPTIPSRDLERALNDPRVLFSAGDRGDPRRQLWRLYAFALWLRHSPPGHIPRHLESRAARLRFGIWSLPVRMDWPPEWRALKVPWSVTGPPGVGDYVDFSQELVLAEARAARDDWRAWLSACDEDPWLAARQEKVESDLRWLHTTWPPSQGGARPWMISPNPLKLGDDDLLATDPAVQDWLLRGSPRAAAAALAPGYPRAWLFLWLFPLASLGVTVLFMVTLVQTAAFLALVLLVLGIGLAGATPSRLTDLALLRIPAAVAVGQVVLISLTDRWWLAPWGWTVGAGLLVIAWFYLVLESRLNGAGPQAYRRGAVIAVVGALHAFVLSLVVLRFVAPVMADHGECLVDWWKVNPWSVRTLQHCPDLNRGYAEASFGVLVLMTGWSLAVGLVAQILWDDRPVTAPLGRQRRVRGATP